MKSFQSICLALFLTSCLVGPNYIPPDPCIPEEWHAPCACEMVVKWWEGFGDPLLSLYMERAALYNQNILIAQSGICQARAMRTITRSQLYPQIKADLNALRIDYSKNGPIVGLGQPAITSPLFDFKRPTLENIFTALLDATWEIDLFGKIRRQVEVEDANIGIAIEQKNGLLLSVLAEVARNYMELRGAQQKLLLVDKNILLLEKAMEISKLQVEKGLANQLVLDKHQAELEKYQASLPEIYTDIYQSIYAISVLTGALPEALFEELSLIQELPEPPLDIGCGIRSDLLRRRPDVREAERNLAATTANIGVAIASFFPSVSLFGIIGFQSLHFKSWFQAPSKTWAFGSNTSMPIFTGGRLVGNLILTECQAAAAGFAYQQTVLNALQEVESALIAYTKELEAKDQLEKTAKKYAEIDLLTQERFRKGLVNMTQTIDSNRTLNNALIDLLQSKTHVLLDSIKLYKALGGGWEEFACASPVLVKQPCP